MVKYYLKDIISYKDDKQLKYFNIKLIINNNYFEFNNELHNKDIFFKSFYDLLGISNKIKEEIYNNDSNNNKEKVDYIFKYDFGENDKKYKENNLYSIILNIIIFYVNNFEKNKRKLLIDIIKNNYIKIQYDYFKVGIFKDISKLNLDLNIIINNYTNYKNNNLLFCKEKIEIDCKNDNKDIRDYFKEN